MHGSQRNTFDRQLPFDDEPQIPTPAPARMDPSVADQKAATGDYVEPEDYFTPAFGDDAGGGDNAGTSRDQVERTLVELLDAQVQANDELRGRVEFLEHVVKLQRERMDRFEEALEVK